MSAILMRKQSTVDERVTAPKSDPDLCWQSNGISAVTRVSVRSLHLSAGNTALRAVNILLCIP